MRAGIKKINLLPKEYIQAQKVKNVQIGIIVLLILEVAAFIGGVVIPPKLEAQEVMARLDEVSAELTDPRFANVNQKIKELEDMKVEVETWNNKYKDIKEENFISKRILDSLLTRIPVGLSVGTLNITKADEGVDKQIVLTGTADETIDIMNYTTMIEGVFGLGSAKQEFDLDKEKGVYNYTIEVKIPSKTVEEVSAEEKTENTEATSESAEGGDSQ